MSVIPGRAFREGLPRKVKVSRDLEEARELSNVLSNSGRNGSGRGLKITKTLKQECLVSLRNSQVSSVA